MGPKSILLAAAMALGAMAQTTSVMGVFLNSPEKHNATLVGSVVSAGAEATTYLVRMLPDPDCTKEQSILSQCNKAGTPSTVTRLYVNGPSTFARHWTEPGRTTWDSDCTPSGVYFNCEVTYIRSPGTNFLDQGFDQTETGTLGYYQQTGTRKDWHEVHVDETTSSFHQVTITAGLEKILAVMTTTSSASAQTVASASSGPSVTGDSASATSASDSTPTSSTTESGAETAAFLRISLAVFCGMIALALGL